MNIRAARRNAADPPSHQRRDPRDDPAVLLEQEARRHELAAERFDQLGERTRAAAEERRAAECRAAVRALSDRPT